MSQNEVASSTQVNVRNAQNIALKGLAQHCKAETHIGVPLALRHLLLLLLLHLVCLDTHFRNARGSPFDQLPFIARSDSRRSRPYRDPRSFVVRQISINCLISNVSFSQVTLVNISFRLRKCLLSNLPTNLVDLIWDVDVLEKFIHPVLFFSHQDIRDICSSGLVTVLIHACLA